MKVAAYQAPLGACYSPGIIGRVRAQVDQCESNGVEILCCPEGVLGGLADHADDPMRIALDASELANLLAPLASETVTTIVGFTENAPDGRLFNSAAVFHRGEIAGVYRKHHPAINRSVYGAGSTVPVFTVGALTFGIIICLDSTFAEPAATLAHLGTRALFIPTNNGLPPKKGGPGLVADARACDARLAAEHGVHVIRADVAGTFADLTSYGSSAITSPGGHVLASAAQLDECLVVADIEPAPLIAHAATG
jgi:predicted amidohydrolase